MLRIPVGVAAVVAAAWVFFSFPSEMRAVAVLLLAISAAILLISAITGTCGIYGVFGINTCAKADCVESDSEEAWVAE